MTLLSLSMAHVNTVSEPKPPAFTHFCDSLGNYRPQNLMERSSITQRKFSAAVYDVTHNMNRRSKKEKKIPLPSRTEQFTGKITPHEREDWNHWSVGATTIKNKFTVSFYWLSDFGPWNPDHSH